MKDCFRVFFLFNIIKAGKSAKRLSAFFMPFLPIFYDNEAIVVNTNSFF